MPKANLAARRAIEPWSIRTPWLVPSLSTRNEVMPLDAYPRVKRMLRPGMLVSLYDLKNLAMIDDRPTPRTPVIYDSGGYEIRDPRLLKRWQKWTQPDYIRAAKTLDWSLPGVLTTFDSLRPGSLDKQIDAGRRLHKTFPDAAIDFLVKPKKHGENLSMEDVQQRADDLSQFSVLGVTEDELGESMFQRCQNLIGLRSALTAANRNTPIHVFGCLDPIPLVLYFLCGADVFDGLQWLRNLYVPGGMVRRQTDAVLQGTWRDPDGDRLVGWTRNLAHLEILTRELNDYCEHEDPEVLKTVAPAMDRIREVMTAVGAPLKDGF